MTASTSREQQQVELVDDVGRPSGVAVVELAHRAPGLAHRAFSVLLTDPTGAVLLQRRAAVKTRFADRWANTCCGHPAPGEDVGQAAVRRLGEELGLTGVSLVEVGIHVYQAADPLTGRVEHEWDHVLIGQVPTDILAIPDPDEVSQLRWADPNTLHDDIVRCPEDYAPWLLGVVNVWRQPSSIPRRAG